MSFSIIGVLRRSVDRLGSRLAPGESSAALRLAFVFYLGHLVCVGWVASSQVFLGLSLIGCLVAWRHGALESSYHPVMFPAAVYVGASAIAAAACDHPGRALRDVEWFTFTALPVGIWLLRRIAGGVRRAAIAVSLGGIVLSCAGAIQFFFLGYGFRGLDQRITGTAAHVMTLSGILLTVSLGSTLLAIRSRRVGWIVVAVVTNFALVLTFTRSAWLGWIAGFGLVVIRLRPRHLLWVVAIAVAAITFAPMPVFSRIVSTFDTRVASNLDRIRMAQAGFQLIEDHPVLGVGPGQIKETYPLYRKKDAPRFRVPHLHNNVLQIWAERGIAALLAYALLVGFTLRFAMQCRGKSWLDSAQADSRRGDTLWCDILFASTIGLAVAGLFEFNFGDAEVLFAMFAWMAMAIAATERGGERIVVRQEVEKIYEE